MNERGREHKPGHAEAQKGGSKGGDAGRARLMATRQQRLLRAAAGYNAQHLDAATQFNQCTQGKCAGDGPGGLSVLRVRSWQAERGLKVDGKIGPGTLARAKQEMPGKAASNEAGGDAAAKSAAVTGESKGEKNGAANATKNGAANASPHMEAAHEKAPEGEGSGEPPANLAEEIVDGGVTEGEEARPEEQASEMLGEAGGAVGEGLENTPEIESKAVKLAQAPHVINLLRQRRYSDALSYLVEQNFSIKEAGEALVEVCEKLGIEAPKLLTAATVYLGPADLVYSAGKFVQEGLVELHKAHEEGRRDNRIYLYSDAWAAGFLDGEYSNSGAVSPEQREAVEKGLRDGKATAGTCGEQAAEIGKQLMARYKDESNVRRALRDALLEHAGIEGIRTAEG